MLTAKVTIRGVRPLLWHHFGLDAIPLERQERTGVAGNDPEEWRATYLATEEGHLYVEPTYIFGSLRDGARYVTKGRGSIQKQVAATVQVLDDRALIDRFMPKGGDPAYNDATADVYIDVRSVRNPATKGRNVRYRVATKTGWTAQFRIRWDQTIVGRQQMEAVTIEAGRQSGLGDGRTAGFGRFEVESFEVEEDG
jgi:hypothetical protein